MLNTVEMNVDTTDNLNDSMDDFWGDFGLAGEPTAEQRAAVAPFPTTTAPAVHYDTCASCRGSGNFVSYTGRVVGKCFKCKGEGKIAFTTAAPVRAAARQKAADKKNAIGQRNSVAWMEANPVETQWLVTNTSFGFAMEMVNTIAKYGHLTEGQLAAVRRLMNRDDMRKQEAVERKATAAVVNVAKIEEAFARATGNGVKTPKLRLDTFKFSAAKASSANAGAIYVKEGEDYLGKIVGGKFMRVRDCTAEQEQRIIAAASDPMAAALAYGHRTGACCICARELTVASSIAAGIGPICQENYFM